MNELLNEQFVVYELTNERYAMKISDIYEIIKQQKITSVHNGKAFLEGVINLRGKIVPVVNLHKRLGLKDFEPTKSTRIIVVQSKEDMVGIIVDKVNQVVRFNDIQSPPEMVAGIDGNYFEGIGLTEDGVVSLLKIEKVLYE